MPKFMLIQHQTPNLGRNPQKYPEEIQDIMERFRAWGAKLRAEGKMISGVKLTEEGGKVVSAQKGSVAVFDGPYSETKEVLGGILLIQAEDYEEAIALARTCPGLGLGSIAVRQVDESAGCGLPAEEAHQPEVLDQFVR
jgi:hypothetical protein